MVGKSAKDGALRAALLSGPPGIGKTTAAHLVAAECGFDILELNASDARNKKSLDVHSIRSSLTCMCSCLSRN
jgi:replication factor C subunit 1